MRRFNIAGTIVLSVIYTLCTEADAMPSITVHEGPNGKETVLGGPTGSIKVLDGPKGRETILSGPNGSINVLSSKKVRRETNSSATQPLGETHSANASVIEQIKHIKLNTSMPDAPNTPERVRRGANATTTKPLGHKASEKVRRETNSSVILHRVQLSSSHPHTLVRREAKEVKEPHGPNVKAPDTPLSTQSPTHAGNASEPTNATTPKVGNVITVPDNCPEGQKYVNGQCREVW